MKTAPFTLGIALAAAPTEARFMPVPGAPRAAPPPADCPLAVRFGSYAMGIDRAAYAEVDRLLRADRGVTSVSRHPWGFEGEVTLCVRTRSRADSNRLFAAIRARLPARPRGPITIALHGGRVYPAPPPPKRR